MAITTNITNENKKPTGLCPIGNLEVGTFFYYASNLWILLGGGLGSAASCYNLDNDEVLDLEEYTEVFEADVTITATIKF